MAKGYIEAPIYVRVIETTKKGVRLEISTDSQSARTFQVTPRQEMIIHHHLDFFSSQPHRTVKVQIDCD